MAEDVKRICLLGAESTGKTTLARSLAESYDTVWNPEYGRPYTELGRDPGAPWTSDEFTHIARIQCWYEDCLAGSARGLLFCDTDAFTTARTAPVPRVEGIVDEHRAVAIAAAAGARELRLAGGHVANADDQRFQLAAQSGGDAGERAARDLGTCTQGGLG